MNITVIAHPGSKKPRITRDPDGTYHVYVHEKAHDGEANAAIMEALAGILRRPKGSLSIIRGLAGRRKVVRVVEG